MGSDGMLMGPTFNLALFWQLQLCLLTDNTHINQQWKEHKQNTVNIQQTAEIYGVCGVVKIHLKQEPDTRQYTTWQPCFKEAMILFACLCEKHARIWAKHGSTYTLVTPIYEAIRV